MLDKRISRLAKNLIDYSVHLEPGENLLIDCVGNAEPMVGALIDYAYKKGGNPFLYLQNDRLMSALLKNCNMKQLQNMAKWDSAMMEDMDAYISVRASENINEMSSVSSEKMALYTKHYLEPVHFDLRVNKTKWCILKYPVPSFAQLAGMPTQDFEIFFFDVCNLDYAKMDTAMDSLAKYMKRTDKVRIVGPETNLTFSIKNMPAIKCSGHNNIPDGEVFTAPIKDSVNGTIQYNTASTYNGITFDNVRLEFRDGKIVRALANDQKAINRVLNTDNGARYVGEFSLGLNPRIMKPINNILFDEKIAGSIHFTPGNSYNDCSNGNKSAIHWDLVLIQQKRFGGGEIWFDDVLVRKDGVFVVKELECLNPENLK